jgi:hypothetical protein
MIHVGSLATHVKVEVIDALVNNLADCISTPCIGGSDILSTVPTSVCLNNGSANNPSFSVTSKVLTADGSV